MGWLSGGNGTEAESGSQWFFPILNPIVVEGE